MEKEKPVPPQGSELARVEDLDRVADELRADYDHERSRRLSPRSRLDELARTIS